MPIVQSRLIDLVTVSSALLNTVSTLKTLAAQADIAECTALANSALDHTNDEGTRTVITHLIETLTMLHNTITSVDIPPAAHEIVISERAHFKKHAVQNMRAANYMRVRRSMERNHAASVTQVPNFNFITGNDAPGTVIDNANSPEPAGRERRQAIQTQMPAPIAMPTMDERIARRKANGTLDTSELMPKTSLSIIPPGENPDADSANQKLDISANANVAAPVQPKTYDPDVLSTSVPSLDELNSAGLVPEGKDVL